MPGEPLIEASGFAAGYDGEPVISGVGFSLAPGERMALLGPNGGGKTTLMRALLGELGFAGLRAVRATQRRFLQPLQRPARPRGARTGLMRRPSTAGPTAAGRT